MPNNLFRLILFLFVAAVKILPAQVITVGGAATITQDAEYSPDGKQIVIASYDYTVRTYDTSNGVAKRILRGHVGVVNSARFNHAGSRIVSTSDDNTTIIWDAPSGARLQTLGVHDSAHIIRIRSAWWSPHDSQVLTMTGYALGQWDDPDNNAVLWDAATGKKLAVFHHTQGINTAAFSPDGKRIITTSNDGTVNVWDDATGTLDTVLRLKASAGQGVFDDNGEKILTASSDGVRNVWDATSYVLISTMQMPGPCVSATFTHDGAKVVASDYNVHLQLYDAANRRGDQKTVEQRTVLDRVPQRWEHDCDSFALSGLSNGQNLGCTHRC